MEATYSKTVLHTQLQQKDIMPVSELQEEW